MKKTSKSPENVEVTPNKKKLKQARLPFMLLSDVSPKAEAPPSRKRKLSVPDAVPATKVGKLSKENSLSEELVVISDEESRGLPSPKKQEKVPNPYVKLVDAARKKKLQKAKGQKKSKKKAKQTKEIPENQSQNDESECDDVEMMDVEAQVHQDGVKDTEKTENNIANGDIQDQSEDKNSKTKETNNNSKGKKNSPQPKTPEKSNNKSNQSSKNLKQTKDISKIVAETICLDDSNNSSDVKMCKATSEETVAQDKEKKSKDVLKKPDTSDSKKSPMSRKKNTPKKRTQVTPKRSSRGQSKKAESNNDNTGDDVQSEPPQGTTYDEHKKIVTEVENNDEMKQKDNDEDSDIEMIESKQEKTESTKETPQESPAASDNEESKSKSEGLVTPKRASRSQTKDTESLDKSVLDESISSTPTTPKQTDKSLNESMKNLTPKQLAIRLEAGKRREAREKEKQEREKKRLQEKEERAKQRQEKEDQKKREREEKEEAKRKEREEKEEQKKKEREEKEKQRELEKKVREEKEEAKKKEKEEKEEQRRKEKEAREEERRKKQEALELEKQEQEMKLKKTKEAFVSFFVPKQKVDRDSSPSEKAPVSKNSMLSSFTVKADMRLAPTVRVELEAERKDALEKLIQEQDKSANYLKFLKDGNVKPGSCGKTWPLEDKDDDVMIVEEDLPPIDGAGEVITCESAPRERLRPKLLAFHENRRPPYWGTWRKPRQRVTPRRPFEQERILDYEVDSDDDWEDEADGESLDGGSAAGSDDDAGNDDYEVDHEVFVPHGYLSDEEATMDEEDDDVLSLSPETQKARLKHLEHEFESEMKKPTEKLKPRLYGLLWETSEGKKPEKCVDALWNYFEKFAMIMGDVTPLLQPAPEPEKDPEKKKIKKKKAAEDGSEQSPKSKKKKEPKSESKDKKPKPEVKKVVPNQPGINTFLKKVQTT
ncbi:hypothetical protein O0L34_g15633 [Tuta absoluta]|nr:hypothetical protein O0L34_g15633 [Tuta absoluta]